MEQTQGVIHWLKEQNWFLLIPAFAGYLNVIVVGAKVMGWTGLANFCGKLEDALTAMIAAYLNRNKALADNPKAEDVKKVDPAEMKSSGPTASSSVKTMLLLCVLAALGGCVGYRLSTVHGVVNGNAISTPYGPLNGNLEYTATTCFGNCPQPFMESVNGALNISGG